MTLTIKKKKKKGYYNTSSVYFQIQQYLTNCITFVSEYQTSIVNLRREVLGNSFASFWEGTFIKLSPSKSSFPSVPFWTTFIHSFNSLCVLVASVMSDSLQPYGLWPTRLLLPMGFSRQEYWSGLPRPPPQALPNSRDWTHLFNVSCIGRRVLYH